MARETFVFSDGKVIPISERPIKAGDGGAFPYIMSDIEPYEDPTAPGKWISTRSAHRDNLRRHGCVEAGDNIKDFVGRR